jgi:hypothetical protein
MGGLHGARGACVITRKFESSRVDDTRIVEDGPDRGQRERPAVA